MSVVETEVIRVKTIDHVTIVVQDIQRSTDFYTKVLGMQQIERPNFGFPGAWFQAGNTQIHLVLQSEQAGSAGIGEFDGLDPSLSFHYAFQVDDCDAVAKRLTELGLQIAVGLRQRPDGARQVYVYDPDGHLIELCSNPS